MKAITSFLKVALPLAFGVFLIWYYYDKLTPEQKEDLIKAFRQADYFWVLASVGCGILSHMSRAIRWKYTIEPLGKTPGFWNSFFTVMIGYGANLLFPRLGEVTRPGLLAKYEDLPFNKLFGTIVAERVADLIILAIIMMSIIIMELDMLRDMLMGYLEKSSGKFSIEKIALLIGIVVVGGGVFFFIMLNKSNNKLFIKIRELLRGIWEGVQSIMKMEKKVYFILHTFFIWAMYIAMFTVCFYSLEETTNAPLTAIIASFVMGSLAIVFVQGGLGVFPVAVMETLMLYGITETSSYALGWILWSSQTLMVIVLSVLSVFLLRYVNKNKQLGKLATN